MVMSAALWACRTAWYAGVLRSWQARTSDRVSDLIPYLLAMQTTQGIQVGHTV